MSARISNEIYGDISGIFGGSALAYLNGVQQHRNRIANYKNSMRMNAAETVAAVNAALAEDAVREAEALRAELRREKSKNSLRGLSVVDWLAGED